VAPYAICSKPGCTFVFDFRENHTAENSTPPFPERCPRCNSVMCVCCFSCGYPIMDVPEQGGPRCLWCLEDIQSHCGPFFEPKWWHWNPPVRAGRQPAPEAPQRGVAVSFQPKTLKRPLIASVAKVARTGTK
jgi:hypothetical protein